MKYQRFNFIERKEINGMYDLLVVDLFTCLLRLQDGACITCTWLSSEYCIPDLSLLMEPWRNGRRMCKLVSDFSTGLLSTSRFLFAW